MDFMINIDLKKLPEPIKYGDRLLLVGSCFTEHIGNALHDLKFSVLQNPHGILFDPYSVCNSLISYAQNKTYTENDLFQLNEVWNSWYHHSRFSGMDNKAVLDAMNSSQKDAHEFLKTADWVVITLGSSFSYRLNENTEFGNPGLPVANCHRAPAQWFNKHLMEIPEIIGAIDNCFHQLMHFNPKLKIIFTVSPVRHFRDGLIENNRSKSRLIEAVHHMVSKFEKLYYFPAYELVIDVLRDYRFYDIDLVHPNYMATDYVLNKFTENCIDPGSQKLMEDIKKIVIARKHKAFQPETNAHSNFIKAHYAKAKSLQEKFPEIDLSSEISYFSSVK